MVSWSTTDEFEPQALRAAFYSNNHSITFGLAKMDEENMINSSRHISHQLKTRYGPE